MLTYLLALAALAPETALKPADRVSEAELAGHIRILASDEFEGRKPGTPASNKTLSYIASAWARAGLQPGAGNGSWYQPVALIDRSTGPSRFRWSAAGKALAIPEEVALGGPAGRREVRGPVIYGGYGLDLPTDIRGRIILLEDAPPANVRSDHRFPGRIAMIEKAGAAAVISIGDAQMTWERVRPFLSRPQTARPPKTSRQEVSGVITAVAAERLLAAAGQNRAKLREAAALPGFKPVPLGVELDASIQTDVRNYTSYNVVARLPGTGADGEAVAITGHWDHLGICRPEGAADRICNGAVDNASGIAVMIEVAERLARGKRSDRDIVFIATTAEESGLLGAGHYVDNPSVPLDKIVAVLNIDTIAIGPRGLPVSAVNRGNTAMDPLIDRIARSLGRTIDTDLDANAFIQRQDGAAFTRAGVPSVMAGGSFADMPKLQRFLGGVYHGPDDEFSDALPLGGAAEDAELHVLLARALADPAQYRRKR